MTAPKDVRHLTQEEVADRLRVDPETVKRWRRLGTGPDYIPVHRRLVVYPEPAVEAWEQNRLVTAAPAEVYHRPRTSRRRHLRTA